MNALQQCPDAESLISLLDCELPEPQQQVVNEHVSSCDTCLHRLDSLVTHGLREDLDFEHVGDYLRRGADANLLSEQAKQQLTATLLAQTEVSRAAVSDLSLDFLQPSEQPGSRGRLGQYEITEVIGRGGMGIALKGRDTQLDRVVAVKVMAPALASNPTARKRFLREAQAAAAVSHDHVVTTFAVEPGELPYLAMEYIDGQSLQEKLDTNGPQQLAEVLRIGMQTASGLAAAHAQGLIHRDIKPSNILLQNSVERVQITDFGLARAVDDVTITRTGEVHGTPQYMSPEQASGLPVDHRTDLFSLGCVLYAMCTGRSPFRAESTMAVLNRVCNDTPRPIHEVNPETPDWLIAIINRLLEKNADDRFQTAEKVADLLGQCLAHIQQPAAVALPEFLPVAKRTRSRHPKWHVGAILLAVLIGSLGMTEATGITQFSSSVITIVRGDGTLVVQVDNPDVSITIEGEDIVITGAGPKEVRLKPGEYKLRALRDGKQVPLEQDLVTITRGQRQVVKITLTQSQPIHGLTVPGPIKGTFVVLSGRGIAEQKFDSLAEAISNSRHGDTVEVRGNGPYVTDPILIKHPLTIRAGTGFHPVIRRSVGNSPGQDSLLRTHDALLLEGLEFQEMHEAPGEDDGSPHHHLLRSYVGAPLYICNCRFVTKHPGGICILSDAPKIVVRNCEFIKPTGPALWRQKSPDGADYFIDNSICSGGSLISVKEPEKAVSLRLNRNTIVGKGPTINMFKVNPKANALAAKVHANASGNILNTWNWVLMVSVDDVDKQISHDDAAALLRQVYTWNDDHNLFWNRGSQLVAIESGVGDLTKFVDDLAEWRQLWNSSDDDAVEGKVLHHGGDLRARNRSNQEPLTREDFRLRPDSAGFRAGPEGKDLGADIDLVGPGKAYERWKETPEYQNWLQETARAIVKEMPNQGQPAHTSIPAGAIKSVSRLKGHTDAINDLAISANGKWMRSAARDENLLLWDVEKQEIVSRFRTSGNITAVAFSPDGKRAAAAYHDGRTRVFELVGDIYTQPIDFTWEKQEHSGVIVSLDFSHDGDKLVSTGRDEKTLIWKAETGTILNRFPCFKHCYSRSIVANGIRQVLIPQSLGILVLRDLESGNVVNELRYPGDVGPGAGCDSLAFSADNEIIASGHTNGEIHLWSRRNDKPLGILRGNGSAVLSVCFTDDGHHLISGGRDKTIRIWSMDERAEIARIETDQLVSDHLVLAKDGTELFSAGGYAFDVATNEWIADGDSLIHRWSLPKTVCPK